MTHHAPYEPTPGQIRLAMRNIRNGWTEKQEQSRRVGCSEKPIQFEPIPDSVFGPTVYSEART